MFKYLVCYRPGNRNIVNMHRRPKEQIPVDILSLSDSNIDDVEQLGCWPLGSTEYLQFADAIALILAEVEAKLKVQHQDFATAFGLIRSELYGEIFKLVAVGCEARSIYETGQNPLFASSSSPIFSGLYNGQISKNFEQIASDESKSTIKLTFRTLAKTLIVRGRSLGGVAWTREKDVDQLSANALLSESAEAMNSRKIWPEALFFRRGLSGTTLQGLEEIADTVVASVIGHICIEGRLGKILRSTVGQIIHQVVVCRLVYAYQDVLAAEKVKSRYLGEVLISGAPKYHGRLLGLTYQLHGKKVIRFEHGGERPFFDDPGWALSELRFCDEYRCFGWAGASGLTRNYASHQAGVLFDTSPLFLAQGSKRHQKLWQKVQSTGGESYKRQAILYVPALYLGEQYRAVSVRFRMNDVVYLNWQIWLIKRLRENGHRVIIKSHPGGLSGVGNVLAKYADGFWRDRYDAAITQEFINVFDFPGTAMIDALATPVPIVLVDSLFRPRNPYTFPDLAERVSIVDGYMTDENLFRVKPDDIKSAIESATVKAENALDFFTKYFVASKAVA
jgi:hypothetical protein